MSATVGSITNGYCTLKQLQDSLGRKINGPFDAKGTIMEQSITRASRFIDKVTSSIFYSNTITSESIDVYNISDSGLFIGPGNECSVVYFPAPVISDVTIVEGGTTLVEDTDYYIYKTQGFIEKGSAWSRTRKDIVITATYGYASVPADIEQACISIAEILSGLVSKMRVTDEGVFEEIGGASIPSNIMDILRRYRREYV